MEQKYGVNFILGNDFDALASRIKSVQAHEISIGTFVIIF